jgi:hypothetical protein
MTTAPPEAPPQEMAREEFTASLMAVALFYRTHPDAELPDGRTLSKRVYGLTYGDKVAELHRIAASWETGVETAPDGTLIARQAPGSVAIAAIVSPPDATLADFHARVAQRKAASEDATGEAA